MHGKICLERAYSSFFWNSYRIIPVLFARSKDQQDEGVEPKPTNHGGKNRASEIIFSQLANLQSLGNLASGLAEPEPGVEQLNKARFKSDEKDPSLHWSQHFKVRLLKHGHRVVTIVDWNGVGHIATWRGATTSLTSLKQIKNKRLRRIIICKRK